MPLQIIRQNIALMKCDAIVNSTDSHMSGSGEGDYAVHQRAGHRLDAECARLVPIETGQVKLTKGYGLDCKYIIHTVGPVWRGGNEGEHEMLRSCYTEALNAAKNCGCRSVAFPLISSGRYGFPKDKVLSYAVEIISEFLAQNEMSVFICIYNRNYCELDRRVADGINSYIAGNDDREAVFLSRKRTVFRDAAPSPFMKPCITPETSSLEDFLKRREDGFAQMLFRLIDESGMSDVECYKRANIDKKVFSKIKCNKNYKPSKQTAVAFAISLRLSLDDTRKLLASAGLALSRSSKFDMIIEYFIVNQNYNIHEINEALFEFDQLLLGSL